MSLRFILLAALVAVVVAEGPRYEDSIHTYQNGVQEYGLSDVEPRAAREISDGLYGRGKPLSSGGVLGAISALTGLHGGYGSGKASLGNPGGLLGLIGGLGGYGGNSWGMAQYGSPCHSGCNGGGWTLERKVALIQKLSKILELLRH